MCVSFSSHGLCGSKHPACTQPRARMRMGRDTYQTSQTPGTTAWGPMPNATQTQAKQYHLGPALELGLGGGQASVSRPIGTLGSLPLPTIHPQTTLCYACLSSNATQTQGQRENNPQSGEPDILPLHLPCRPSPSLRSPCSLPCLSSLLLCAVRSTLDCSNSLSRTFGVQEPRDLSLHIRMGEGAPMGS